MEEISGQKKILEGKRREGNLSAETSLSLPHERKAQTSQTFSSSLLPTLKNLCSSFLSPTQTNKSSSPQEDKTKLPRPEPKESDTLLDPEFVVVPRKGMTKGSKDIRAYQGGNLDKENQADIYYWNIKVTPPSLPMLRLRCLREVHPVFSYIYRKACLFRRSKKTEEASEPKDEAKFFKWAWSEASSHYKDDSDDLAALLAQIQSTENEISKLERESKEINNRKDKEELRDEDEQNKEEDLIRLKQLRRKKDEQQQAYRERAREQEPLAILRINNDREKNLFFKELFEELNQLAEQKDLKATLSVGQLYLWGLGCQQNNARAYQHIQLASDSLECLSTANEILGLLSEEKSSEDNDPSKVAEQYYKKMAEQDPHGYIHLARLFHSKKKTNEAIGFLESATEKDYQPALWALAKLGYMNKEEQRFDTLQSYQDFLRNVHDHLRVIHFLQEAASQNNNRAKEALTKLRNELKNKRYIENLNDHFREVVIIRSEIAQGLQRAGEQYKKDPKNLDPEITKGWRELFLEDLSQPTEELESIIYIDQNNRADAFIPDDIDLRKISRSKIENCMRLAAAGFPMGYFLLGQYVMLVNPGLGEFCFQRAEHPKMTSYLAMLTYITPGMGHLNADALKKEIEEDLKEEVKKALEAEVKQKSINHLEKIIKKGVTEEVQKKYEELHKKQLGNLIQAKIGRVFKPGDEETWKRMYGELLPKKYEISFKEKFDEEEVKKGDEKRRKKRAHALWDKARSEGDLLAYYCQGSALYEEWKNLTQLPGYNELSQETLNKSNELFAYVLAPHFKIPQLTPDNPTPKLPRYFARTEFRERLEEIRASFTMQALEELF